MAEKSRIANIIEQYKQELKKLNINPDKIILFGSYAEDTQREGSDIDLIVISNDFQPLNLRERLELLGLAAGRIMEPIEALGYTDEELEVEPRGSFLWNVMHANNPVYIS
jgi:uncharacterized protein